MIDRGRRAALGAALASGLTGCASLPPPALGAPDGQPALPGRVLLEHPPFHPQLAFQCGPAALATALGATGVTVAPERLALDVFLPARQGSLQVEMLAGARRHGRVATRIAPRLGALLQEVAAGDPVVLLQNLGLAWVPVWHYAVAVGYDLPGGELLLRSGGERLQRMLLTTFDRTWARSGRWAFLVLPPGRFPLSADEPEAVQALLGFERVAPPAEAVRGYRGALQRWPGSLPLGLGLGNALHASGDRPGAARAFEALTLAHPDSPPAWINLALTRLEVGQVEAARAAARRALRLAGEGGADAGRWLADAQAALQRVDASRSSTR